MFVILDLRRALSSLNNTNNTNTLHYLLRLLSSWVNRTASDHKSTVTNSRRHWSVCFFFHSLYENHLPDSSALSSLDRHLTVIQKPDISRRLFRHLPLTAAYLYLNECQKNWRRRLIWVFRDVTVFLLFVYTQCTCRLYLLLFSCSLFKSFLRKISCKHV